MINASVLIAGSGNVTGMNVIRALDGHVENLVGYDCCPIQENASNIFCANETVPRTTDQSYASAIMDLVRKHQITHVIASNDHDVRALMLARQQSEWDLRVPVNATTSLTLSFLDKLDTSHLFETHGIPTPARLDLATAEPPFVVRKRFVGGSKKYTYVVHDREATPLPPNLDNPVTTRFMEGDEYTIDILAQQGRPVAIVPRLRKMVMPPGIVWLGEVVKDDLIIQECANIIQKLQLDGMYCAQCIRTRKNCYFFEINPRPGSGIDLSTAARINMPVLWLRMQLGERISAREPDWGMKMVRYYSAHYYK
jgi:carbamoyl-phosphate synthase large subunit